MEFLSEYADVIIYWTEQLRPYALPIHAALTFVTIAFFLIAMGMANQATGAARSVGKARKSTEKALAHANDLTAEIRHLAAQAGRPGFRGVEPSTLRAAGVVKAPKPAEPTSDALKGASLERPAKKSAATRPAERKAAKVTPKFLPNPAIARAATSRRRIAKPSRRPPMTDAAARA